MDEILAKASNQAMSFAIRSGISIASGFAIKTVSKFLDKIPQSEKARIEAAKLKLRTKINIVSSSIDLIKLEAARGDSALEATLQLVNELKLEIDVFDIEMKEALENFNSSNEKDTIKHVESIINRLIESINDAIPLINLSLLTCGVSFKSAMSSKISPSRLLQSSCLLHESNKIDESNLEDVLVGPLFDLKLFTVFYNPSRLKYIEEDKSSKSSSIPSSQMLMAISWKEEYARALIKLVRTRGKNFDYQLVIEEDYDDGRYHDEDEKARTKRIKVGNIRKQFFSASGRLLRLEGSNSPVLILKTQVGTDYEYIAFGETGAEFDGSDDEQISRSSEYEDTNDIQETEKVKTLSLLEYLLRLASLQEMEQKSILEINDEKLTFYLSNQADGSAIPKSSFERAIDNEINKETTQSLQLDSNINRLKHLSLGEK